MWFGLQRHKTKWPTLEQLKMGTSPEDLEGVHEWPLMQDISRFQIDPVRIEIKYNVSQKRAMYFRTRSVTRDTIFKL